MTTTYTRISADCHIDLPMLPTDLFTANASAVMKERMPYVTDGPDGPYWTCKNGGVFGLVCGGGAGGQKVVARGNHRAGAVGATGRFREGQRGGRRPSCPPLSGPGTGIDC